ncbi:peptide deformylase [Streptomyces sp. H27-C3]|uniref:peptide deformylase n=1 Tax=Streptomyces sp. H27-C3 TaxID=3046305 RepID=UPI0024BB3FE6|nr:peptide deformylase [Streptomyces sp. H27-C3]MDJ0463876.1 peptide deformylase [Streptomyces sp. H27-C3]
MRTCPGHRPTAPVERPWPAEAAGGSCREITEIGNPVVHRRCADIAEFGTAELSQLLKDMFFTMHVAHGLGLAANQIGLDLRLFVYDCPGERGERHIGHILNPELHVTGEYQTTRSEGCLSVPGAAWELIRPASVTVRGQDWRGNPVTVSGTGLFARCLRHETDHTDGTLFVDRLVPEERYRSLSQMYDNRAAVMAERAEWARSMARS